MNVARDPWPMSSVFGRYSQRGGLSCQTSQFDISTHFCLITSGLASKRNESVSAEVMHSTGPFIGENVPDPCFGCKLTESGDVFRY